MNLQDYYRQRRRMAAARRWGRVFIFFLVLFAALWGFFWIPFFRVTEVGVYNYPDAENVKNALQPHLQSRGIFWLPQNSFWLLGEDELTEILRSKDFGTPKVEKKFPRGLNVAFPEIAPWLIFCQSAGECFYVSDSGELGDRAPTFSENPLPELLLEQKTAAKTGDGVISAEEAGFLSSFFGGLAGISAAPTKVKISAGGIRIYLKEGWFIYASAELEPQKIINDLRLLLEQKIGDSRPELEYVDMRFADKAFYKLKSIN